MFVWIDDKAKYKAVHHWARASSDFTEWSQCNCGDRQGLSFARGGNSDHGLSLGLFSTDLQLGLSGRNSGKIPEILRKRSQSFCLEFPSILWGWGWFPSTYNSNRFDKARAFQEFCRPLYGSCTSDFTEWSHCHCERA